MVGLRFDDCIWPEARCWFSFNNSLKQFLIIHLFAEEVTNKNNIIITEQSPGARPIYDCYSSSFACSRRYYCFATVSASDWNWLTTTASRRPHNHYHCNKPSLLSSCTYTFYRHIVHTQAHIFIVFIYAEKKTVIAASAAVQENFFVSLRAGVLCALAKYFHIERWQNWQIQIKILLNALLFRRSTTTGRTLIIE